MIGSCLSVMWEPPPIFPLASVCSHRSARQIDGASSPAELSMIELILLLFGYLFRPLPLWWRLMLSRMRAGC